MSTATDHRNAQVKPVHRGLEPTPAIAFAWLGLCYWTIPWEC